MNKSNKSGKIILYFFIFAIICSIFIIIIAQSQFNNGIGFYNNVMMPTNKEGYFYNPESKVIYIRIGNMPRSTSFVEHYSPNGNLYRYNIETNTFEEIIKGG